MKKGNTHAQVSPFVPDRLLGRPLPPPGGLRMQWPGLIPSVETSP